MKIFLELKSWQVFLMWLLGGIQIIFFIESDLLLLSIGFYLVLVIGWVYAIGKVLNENNIEQTNKLNNWTGLLFVALILVGINFQNIIVITLDEFKLQFLYMSLTLLLASYLYIVSISAKAIKESEGEKNTSFIKYASEFFLIVYMSIGVWFIQPRLNKLMEKNNH